MGYQPNCHLQCVEGLAVSEDPEIFVVSWQMGWLTSRSNSVTITGCDLTVIVAWCQGSSATDIVLVTNEEDYNTCTNLEKLPDMEFDNDGMATDGFISMKNTGGLKKTLYYASKSNCKIGMKVKVEFN